MTSPEIATLFVLDVGGEGRHPQAWCLNPSPVRTIGKQRGWPIPRHVFGRADNMPFPDRSVDKLIVERTPLNEASLHEIARVISPTGIIILRHAQSPIGRTHAIAREILPGPWTQRVIQIGGQSLQETVFTLGNTAAS